MTGREMTGVSMMTPARFASAVASDAARRWGALGEGV